MTSNTKMDITFRHGYVIMFNPGPPETFSVTRSPKGGCCNHLPGFSILTLVLLRGGCTNPPNGFLPGAQNRTAKG